MVAAERAVGATDPVELVAAVAANPSRLDLECILAFPGYCPSSLRGVQKWSGFQERW